MWTDDAVKKRFIEATKIEQRIKVKGGPSAGNAWPSYAFTKEDRDGWDDLAKQDEVDELRRICITTAAQIQRWSECYFEWTPMIPIERRVLVWRFAYLRGTGGSFSAYCDRKGLVRMTAYNRLDRIFSGLAARFNKEGRRLVEAEEERDLQNRDGDDKSMSGFQDGMAGRREPKSWRSDPSVDLLNTPEAVAAFEQHLAETRERRRKARLRKALRGVPDEQEAAA